MPIFGKMPMHAEPFIKDGVTIRIMSKDFDGYLFSILDAVNALFLWILAPQRSVYDRIVVSCLTDDEIIIRDIPGGITCSVVSNYFYSAMCRLGWSYGPGPTIVIYTRYAIHQLFRIAIIASISVQKDIHVGS